MKQSSKSAHIHKKHQKTRSHKYFQIIPSQYNILNQLQNMNSLSNQLSIHKSLQNLPKVQCAKQHGSPQIAFFKSRCLSEVVTRGRDGWENVPWHFGEARDFDELRPSTCGPRRLRGLTAFRPARIWKWKDSSSSIENQITSRQNHCSYGFKAS